MTIFEFVVTPFARICYLTSVSLFMKKVGQTSGYTLFKSEVGHQCGFVHDKDYPNFLSDSGKNEVVLFSLYTVSVLCYKLYCHATLIDFVYKVVPRGQHS